jgi:Pyruvate/2-oxoacid:ferredoxin oxidoreductase delta subunit
MSQDGSPVHYVCTRGEAADLIDAAWEFWVCNCGCREAKGSCGRSRHDVCLMFADAGSSGSGKRRIDRVDAEAVLSTARDCGLVARPFRNAQRTAVEGICFCCDDCCGYFLDPTERCDKGPSVESTRVGECNACGLCEDVCYFGARSVTDAGLIVKRDRCHGCGLCADVCPEDCVDMVPRGEGAR